MRHKRFNVLIVVGSAIAWLGSSSASWAANFELFEFNDGNTTQLADAANSANAGNNWVVDAQMAPSQVQNSLGGRPSSYYIIKSSTASDNNFLQLADITSGTRYLTTKIAGWNFQETSNEQFRLAFINSDTAPNFGNLITAQVSLVRGTDGTVELTGGALGPGSSPVVSSAFFPPEHDSPFEMTLELNKTANTYKVFYRDGTSPTQVLGAGTLDPSREGKALRLQATGNFGDFAGTFPSDFIDFLAVDRVALTDVNPHADLITLEIDRDNGAMTLRNMSGSAISGIESYSITSEAGSLLPANWTPIAGGTNTSAKDLLMQSFASNINLTVGQATSLSNASGAWLKTPMEDVQMVLNLAGGVTRTVNVNFIDNGGLRWAAGDLNVDGSITPADYTILTMFAETSLSGLTDAEAYRKGDLDRDGINSILDFSQFKTIYDAANGGAGAFDAMFASVPEPGCLLLLGTAGAISTLGHRRRRGVATNVPAIHQKCPHCLHELPGEATMRLALPLLSFVIAIAAIVVEARVSHAAILEDFLFSDSNGTLLQETVNSASVNNFWIEEDANRGTSSVLNGSFHIVKQNDETYRNVLDIANVTSGKVWYVAEFAGWSFSSLVGPNEFDSTQLEQINLTFLDLNADPEVLAITSSRVAAQASITRQTDGTIRLGGNALPAGTATNIANSVELSLTQSNPFSVVLEFDKPTNRYSVYYRNNNDAFSSIGAGNIDPARNGDALRFYINNSVGGTGEYIDLNRLYLTDTSPISGPVEPVTLTLEVRSNGHVLIKNETPNAISFDSYRIASASGALNFAGWNSLSNQGIDAVGGGNDPGETWDISAGSSDNVLAESFLLGESTLDPSEELVLGSAFEVGGLHDLTFQYRDAVSGLLPSIVPTYVTVVGVLGDYNQNGIVDAADYTVWRNNLGSETALPNDDTAGVGVDDYNRWKANFGQTAGAGSSALSNAAVPEPATFVLLLLAIAGWCFRLRRTP